MTPAPAPTRYWRAARQPRYSITFAFPLLVAYEALAFGLSHASLTGVRNGADVMLVADLLAYAAAVSVGINATPS